MLVLSRKPGQSIQIADDVTVSVLSSTGNRVLLGIKAPTEKRIVRAELEHSNREPVVVNGQPIERPETQSRRSLQGKAVR